MSNTNTAMGWATLAGIVLVAAGLLGFLNTSIAGEGAGALPRGRLRPQHRPPR